MFEIARHEFQHQFRDGRLTIASLAFFALLVSAIVSGWVQHAEAQRQHHAFTSEARAQWLTQGERHPHHAAHFGNYVVKPELSLALFEPGLRPFVGQTLWLEAHERPAFTNIPSEDDQTLNTGLGVVSGAAAVQMLGSLLALVIGSLAIVGEREKGTLRQALSQGVRPGVWIGGKIAGLASILAVPIVPAAVIAMVGFLLIAPADTRSDVGVRAVLMLSTNGLLILIALIVGLTVSALVRTSRAALLLALGLWISGFILAPRLASTLSSHFAPTPSLAEYNAAVGDVFDAGFDKRGGYMQQFEALRVTTLEEYGVETLDALETGYSGIRMKHLDAWSTEVDDREFARLQEVYGRQQAIRLGVSSISPFVAARSVSQGMAAMDWAHYQDFLTAAERYRREFGYQMNDLLQQRVTGERWEMDGQNADWAKVEPFQYHNPSAFWAIRQQTGFLMVLLLWLAASWAALAFVTRRLRP
ncbi:ABC transporter permease subunit [uncultured Algimonas sp.]|uniref:ABC transporter permease subunit n=1 Tax=uncultured Algimonas sp. TaxID=1547920 RepID=UPI00262694E4|nr:ABC transporter permease subunit [uncultured Algimonas sp.]